MFRSGASGCQSVATSIRARREGAAIQGRRRYPQITLACSHTAQRDAHIVTLAHNAASGCQSVAIHTHSRGCGDPSKVASSPDNTRTLARWHKARRQGVRVSTLATVKRSREDDAIPKKHSNTRTLAHSATSECQGVATSTHSHTAQRQSGRSLRHSHIRAQSGIRVSECRDIHTREVELAERPKSKAASSPNHTSHARTQRSVRVFECCDTHTFAHSATSECQSVVWDIHPPCRLEQRVRRVWASRDRVPSPPQ